MTEAEYEKVFRKITGLSQKYAVGQLPFAAFHDGVKTLIEESIASSLGDWLKIQRNKAFWRGCIVGGFFFSSAACAGFLLWRKGFLIHP